MTKNQRRRFFKPLSLLIMTFFITTASAVDTVNSINGPTSITKGQSITVNIDYETGDKDLLFALQKAKSPWTEYRIVRKHSNEGGKQIEFTVPDTIPDNTPLMYQAFLTKKGKYWKDRVSVKYKKGISLGSISNNNKNKELIYGGGNKNGSIDRHKWLYFGNIYHQQSRKYNGKNFIYSTPKDVGSGMYQKLATKIGREYEVSAILIGSDTNRDREFNGESYLTISSEIPEPDKNSVFKESEHVRGAVETKVSFRFTAISSKTYLALRSDKAWHYASARAISVKAVDNDAIDGNTKPTITLKGNSNITIIKGDTYKEIGAKAYDAEDGDITENIEITEHVNTSTVGIYKVKYNVSDSDGNKADEVVRIVKVIDNSNNDHHLAKVILNNTLVIKNDNQTLKNTHFICSNTNFAALKIFARNTVVKGNLFENCATGIILSDAFNTHITGNRFKHVGAGVIGTGGVDDGSVITYNEFTDIGSLDCTVAVGGRNCNIYGARENSKNSIFSHNLIDNRGSNARYMEDYINIYSARNKIKQNVKVVDNTLIGSLVSSKSGACIVIDGRGSRYEIRKNRCYNVSGYGISAASSSDVKIENNLVYMDEEHVKHITRFKSREKIDASYAYGVTAYYKNCASHVTFINNKGYNFLTENGNIRYGWRCLAKNRDLYKWSNEKIFSLEGNYENGIVLHGNKFYENDPHWEIPDNLFNGLDSKYFSGNRH